MDISNHKQLTNSSWEPYNNIILSSMDDDHHQGAPTFDHHPQWPNNYYNLPMTNNDSSNSPSAQQNDLLQAVQPHNLISAAAAAAAVDQDQEDPDHEELGAMKEMMFKIAAMQPVDIDPTTIRKPRRRNVRISDDPQSVAARHRRERISEKIRILQRLVPGGTKMDTASMLDEAIRYVKFLKRQIRILQGNHHHHHQPPCLGIPSTSAAAGTTPPGYLFGGNKNDIGVGDHEHPMF